MQKQRCVDIDWNTAYNERQGKNRIHKPHATALAVAAWRKWCHCNTPHSDTQEASWLQKIVLSFGAHTWKSDGVQAYNTFHLCKWQIFHRVQFEHCENHFSWIPSLHLPLFTYPEGQEWNYFFLLTVKCLLFPLCLMYFMLQPIAVPV